MNDTLSGSEPGLKVYYKFNEIGQGGNIAFKNSAISTIGNYDGTTVSVNPGFPRFASTEVLPFPPPPLIPDQAAACHPGGPVTLAANTPNGFNINRFYWYRSDFPDTSRIPNTIRRTYTTPPLTTTDTFYVSAVTSQMCESRKARVVAKVLPPLAPVAVNASKLSFCRPENLTFQATPFPGARYAWFRGYNGTQALTFPDSGSVITIPNQSKTDTLWAQYRLPGASCFSSKAFVVVNRVALPPGPVLSANNTKVCPGKVATTTVPGTGSQLVRLFTDSLLTNLIGQVGLNQNVQTPPILTNRVFWVALSADANGCESQGSKWVVGLDTLPNAQIGLPDTVCAGTSFQATSTGKSVYRYQWTPSPVNLPQYRIQYSSDTVAAPTITFSNTSFTPLPQTFKVVVTDRRTGCQKADSVRVIGGFLPPGLGRSDTTVCGSQNVRLARLLTPALANQYDGNFQYQRTTNAGTLQNPGGRNTAALNLANTGQTVLLANTILTTRDSRTGCSSKDTVRISSNPLPVVVAGNQDTVCAGQTFQLGSAANPLYRYKWTPSANNLPVGTVITYSSDTVANPTLTYSNGFFSLVPRFFKVLATNRITGCQKADSVRITGGANPPQLGRTDTLVCGNASFTLARTLEPTIESLYDNTYQYQWTSSLGSFQSVTSRKSTFTLANTGQTSLIATSVLTTRDSRTGCTTKDTITLVSNPLPLAIAGRDTSLCSGFSSSIGFAGNPAQVRYKWTPSIGLSNDTLSKPLVQIANTGASFTRTFVLQATNRSTGCRRSDTVSITSHALPQAIAGSDKTLCASESASLGTTGNTGQIRYRWSPATQLANDTLPQVTLLAANPSQQAIDIQFILSAENRITRCKNSDTVQVRIQPLPLVSAGKDTVLCSGFSSPLGFGGNSLQNAYKWLPANGLSSDTTSNPNVLLVNSGASFTTRYILQATNRATGCRKSDTVLVTSHALPQAIAGSDKTLCANDTVKLGTSGSTAQVAYLWAPSTFLLSDTLPEVSLIPANASQQPVEIQYILSTENRTTKCRNSDTLLVKINPLPLVEAGRDTTLCSGESVALGFPGNLQNHSFQWLEGSGLSNDTLPNPVYRKVIGNIGISESKILRSTNRLTRCHKEDTVRITVYPLPQPNAGPNQSICYNSTVNLGTGQESGFAYNWSPADSLSTPNAGTTILSYFNSDTVSRTLLYVLTVRNQTTGCEAKDSVDVEIKPFIRADAGNDLSICSGDTVVGGKPASPGYSYQWTPTAGVTDPSRANPGISRLNTSTVADTITYYRNVTLLGCQNSDSIKVVVFPRPGNLTISGSKNVCPGTSDVGYGVPENPFNHVLTWTVSGGTLTTGNSGDSVRVTWGITNPNARVKCVPVNSFGCKGDSVTYNVKVNTLLFPEIGIVSDRSLVHNDSVCQNQGNRVRYRTSFTTPGSTYAWTINPPEAGTILGAPKGREVQIRWNVPGTHELSVSQFDTTNIDTCFGSSQIYSIHVLPSPDTTLQVLGDSIACAFSVGHQFRLQGNPQSVYQWAMTRVTENTAVSPEPGLLQVGFGAPGSDTIRVIETNTLKCPGKWLSRPVSVKPLPDTKASLFNSYQVCPEKSQNIGYRVSGLSGSSYNWLLSGSYENLRGQGTDSITVNWTGVSQGIKVFETTAFSCRKDTLTFAFKYDNSSPVIQSVSTLPEDDSKIEIRFQLANAANHPTGLFELWKDGSFLSAFNNQVNQFVDGNVNPGEQVYRYELRTKNSCNSILRSPTYYNMLLKSTGFPTENKASLRWNKYAMDSQGQVTYRILRRADGELKNNPAGSLVFESGQSPDELNFESFETSDGFEQCYRIAFSENGTVKSLSNWDCIDFENRIQIPNLVTANNDGKNDVFEIRNLGLYPAANLTIFDRWGNKVFSTGNYQNNWAGRAGIYYYSLTVGNLSYNGYVQVHE